ncbi:MAG TPA: ferrichrome ABC transporter permease [Myxococcales bacterium]|nr:ferrichrome ABC transporter permease [Myxococcales bacterium]
MLLFSVAIFCGAFLIFLVQPMVAKRILPWFGGGPGVWMLCLMFYQSTLFMGYAYAHALVRFARPTVQLGIHALVFAASFALLPVLPGDGWKPGPLDDPSYSILALLFANVALPFIALAATGPLVQAWFARRHPNRSPYALYAVSNIGSLAALLAFPSLIEPLLPLATGGRLWSVGFVAAGMIILACGAMAMRPSKMSEASGDDRGFDKGQDKGLDKGQDRSDEETVPIGWTQFCLWLLLSSCAVILLMAVTNKLCLDVASIPFLWILPLGLYLVSFILCFGSERFYSRPLWIGVAATGLLIRYGVAGFLPSAQTGGPLFGSLPAQILFFSFILFSLCMLMHGELYRLRPPARRLTFFYLAVSGGGALGGLFVGLLAPRIFTEYHELAVGLGLALILMVWILGRDSESWLYIGGVRWRFTTTAAAAAVLLVYTGSQAIGDPSFYKYQERSFFGVLRVTENEPTNPAHRWRSLVHGTTTHGVQALEDEKRRHPTAYFGLGTGIGVALTQRAPHTSLNVGIIGLGVGTLAAYAQPGDRFRFYEIDPSVIRIARDERFFSFLQDSHASIELVRGDARLSLQQEMDESGGKDFDVLIVDAFSSDSIPVHLITREVFDLYFKHMKMNGLLAVHVSNRFFDLRPIVFRIGIDMNVELATISNMHGGIIRLGTPAKWIFLSRDKARLRSLGQFVALRSKRLGLNSGHLTFGVPNRSSYEHVPLWTDDYSSLLALLAGNDRVQ